MQKKETDQKSVFSLRVPLTHRATIHLVQACFLLLKGG